MSNKSLPQYVQFDLPFDDTPSIVHCPICGGATRIMEEESLKATPCDHVAFIYSFDDFEYMSEDFEKRIEDIDDEGLIYDLTFDAFKEFLQKLGYDNQLLAMEMTYSGMACGPMDVTEVYGFDYGTLAEKGES